MRKIVISLLTVGFFVMAASTPFVPELCVVCGENECKYDGSKLRIMSIIEWSMDYSTDCHFGCAKDWDVATNKIRSK
tara:strand:- start:129 stop:359 length:231 start_codon:yes stop_codon:yes gene_type:complete